MSNSTFYQNHQGQRSQRFYTLSAAFLLTCFVFVSACASQPLQSEASNAVAPPAFIAKDTGVCPKEVMGGVNPYCYTPRHLRAAYGIESLTARGLTGKGQTVIVTVSFGSPTIQQDVDIFSRQYGLPPAHLSIVSPLGTIPFDAHNNDMSGWAIETTLDVETIHAIAPEANIVLLTSPVSETEGTVGLPEFLKMEQYAVSHHLGNVISHSWVASEATFQHPKDDRFLQQMSDFYQDATLHQGITIVNGSGDHGAAEAIDMTGKKQSTEPTVNFPVDLPWITAIGGTTLKKTGQAYTESTWSGSGGGISKTEAEPDFQKSLPAALQAQFNGHRGLPDVAAVADSRTEMAIYVHGFWVPIGGTSASTPLWAGIVAIGNQMAGHPLGFLNPALYKIGQSSTYAADFHDITTGDNTYIDPQTKKSVQGYKAVAGWDAATGWGTPQADHLLPDLIHILADQKSAKS